MAAERDAPAGCLGHIPSDASIFARRGLSYPSFASSRPPKELRGGGRHAIRALAWNSDGKVLISSCNDGSAHVWNPDRGSDVRPTHPDLLATGSIDKTVRLWDLRMPQAARVVQTPGSNINLTYHPNGRYIALGDKSETVSCIDATQGEFLYTIKDGAIDRQEINELAWSPDGRYLLMPTGNGSVTFLDVPDAPDACARTHSSARHPDWKLAAEHFAHPATIFCLQWDPTSRLVATAAADSTIGLWNADEWTCAHVFSEFKYPARSLSFSHDGEWLAAGGEDTQVHIMSTATGNVAHRLDVTGATNAVAWHPSRQILAYSGSEPATVPAPARTPPIWLYSVP
ncbi:hypothetical protein MCUN1_000027 [Malassezia cuniculi]|uniref:Anaphase-promoting complex subunit 4-like WD40 domain-containing protein n=1 Tax=Malassezia cuniculi TaxID=948313 RepID=A0AAF0EQ71_9BASI|nr:hypothetical protein MCUN1_000027 [Malassezia cuniculi]